MYEFEAVMLFVSTFLCWCFLKFLQKAWVAPSRLEAKMRSQGMRGPSYKFPKGNTDEISYMRSQFTSKPMDISHNVHDLFPRLHPHVYAWTKVYGRNFTWWHGSKCQVVVTEPELSKEILMNREGAFPKMEMKGCLKKLMGDALTTNEGQKWATVRKLADRSFHADSLKSMVPEMSRSVATMLGRWDKYEGREIDAFQEFEMLTTEVISQTAFGSSYSEGKHIFEMKQKLVTLAVKNLFKARLPGISLLVRSDDEVEAERLEQRINSSILEKVRERENNGDLGGNYLGQLVRSSHESDVNERITRAQMIEEIKAIYGAGNRTTTSLLGWCVFLLATHTEWQDRARQEVNQTFGGKIPDSDGISRLKIMTMILNECLRLYPPALSLAREVSKETKIGELCLYPNTNIFISVLALHHDPRIWGDDVLLFKPERFAHGVVKATNNNAAAFLPFGMGARICVGLSFTTNQAKIALSMILHNYNFVLSPNYVHCPLEDFILVPRNGIQVILQKI